MLRQLFAFTLSHPVVTRRISHIPSSIALSRRPIYVKPFRQISSQLDPHIFTMTARVRKKRTTTKHNDEPEPEPEPEPEAARTNTRARSKRTNAKNPEDEPAKVETAPEVQPSEGETESKKPKRKPRKKAVADPEPLTEQQTAAMLQKGALIKRKLEEIYPEAPTGFLDNTSSFTLLIAVLLSAQSLDTVVNAITPALFKQGGTPVEMAALSEDTVRSLIKRVGLAPTKAKNIVKLSKKLVEEFDGEVPQTFEELESLPGVGHKTASVVMMQAFGRPAFPVDTHIWRLACRWGIGDPKSVDKTEESLKKWFPDEQDWADLHVRMILFGREHCPARKHDMQKCPICKFAATKESLEMNEMFQDKFVGAARHGDPFSIREVEEVEEEVIDGDGEIIDEKIETKKKSKTRKGTSKVAATKKSPRKRTRTKMKEERVSDSDNDTDVNQNDDDEDFQPSKRAKKASTRANPNAKKQAAAKDEQAHAGRVRRSSRKKM